MALKILSLLLAVGVSAYASTDCEGSGLGSEQCAVASSAARQALAPFLKQIGLHAHLEALVADGWEDEQMLALVEKEELIAVGLTDADANKMLGALSGDSSTVSTANKPIVLADVEGGAWFPARCPDIPVGDHPAFGMAIASMCVLNGPVCKLDYSAKKGKRACLYGSKAAEARGDGAAVKTIYMDAVFPKGHPGGVAWDSEVMTLHAKWLLVAPALAPMPKEEGKRAALKPLPVVTVAEFEASPELQSGLYPFKITDATNAWPARKKWNLDYFTSLYPNVSVSYYPQGKKTVLTHGGYMSMYDMNVKFKKDQKTTATPYMLWYIELDDWRGFEADAAPMNKWLLNQEMNLEECMGKDGLAMFYKFIFWRMILVGRPGTIFELHYDSVQSATWQAQVTGRKRWTICPPEEKPYLYEVPPEIYGKGSSNLNTFDVDLEMYPLWERARCYDVIAGPGDLLYYPPDYWHQTMNLDEESVALTSRVIHPNNFHDVFEEFRWVCSPEGAKKKLGPHIQKEFLALVCPKLDACEALVAERVQDMVS